MGTTIEMPLTMMTDEQRFWITVSREMHRAYRSAEENYDEKKFDEMARFAAARMKRQIEKIVRDTERMLRANGADDWDVEDVMEYVLDDII